MSPPFFKGEVEGIYTLAMELDNLCVHGRGDLGGLNLGRLEAPPPEKAGLGLRWLITSTRNLRIVLEFSVSTL